MNIVKFHGYWQDRAKADDRPRVSFCLFREKQMHIYCDWYVLGCFYYGVYVKWLVKSIFTENKKDETKFIEKFLETVVYSIIICFKVCLEYQYQHSICTSMYVCVFVRH